MLPKHSLFGTINSQLYLDSEETFVNDLKDTFSYNTNEQFKLSNALKINTSTYSVNRTVNYISQRLRDASQRLQSISTSVNKNKKTNIKVDQQVVRKINNYEVESQKKQKEKIYSKEESQLMEIIRKLNKQLKVKNHLIQQIQQKLSKTQSELLSLEQKYLRKQNNLISEINKLKDLLLQKIQNENKHFNQKVELERVIDEQRISVYQNKKKISLLEDFRKKWCKKQTQLAKNIRKYSQNEWFVEKGEQNKLKLSDFIKSFKVILEIDEIEDDHDKQNNCQLSNRGKKTQYKKQSNFNCQNPPSKLILPTAEQIYSNIQQSQQHQDVPKFSLPEQMYRFLFAQATSIQQLIH